MNELSELWQTNADWSMVFDESDRLLVESIVRLAQRESTGLDVGTDDESLLTALLILAKSLRRQHVALPLDLGELDDLITTQLWRPTHDNAGYEPLSTPSARYVRDGLLVSSTLARQVVTVASLAEEVSVSGPPVIVSTRDGVARYAAFRRYAHAEYYIARRLLDESPLTTSAGDLVSLLAGTDETANESTARFVRRALTRRVTVLTGGPGTGKTTVIASLLGQLRASTSDRPIRVALCAPTAKAAVRMREAIDQNLAGAAVDPGTAQRLDIDERSGSVHRLLGIRPTDTTRPRILDHDLVIVDEASMMEFSLLNILLRSSEACHVVLVGDPDQLASVNVGAVLRDIVDACDEGALPATLTRLTTNYRSNQELVAVARSVNEGDFASFRSLLDEADSRVSRFSSHEDALAPVIDHATVLYERARQGDDDNAIRTLSQHALLCATREGDGSIQWWHARLIRALRPLGYASDEGRFPVGTPLLVTMNEAIVDAVSGDELLNGDVGIVTRHDDSTRAVFGPSSHVRRRSLSSLHRAEAAWALTIHKSQGSEFDNVTISLPEFEAPLLTRELLYTALTRARVHATIVGSDAIIERALQRRISRVSGLRERVGVLRATSGA